MTLTEYISSQLQAAFLAEWWLLENLLNLYRFSLRLFFVSRTNYQGNKSILKMIICRTDERDCLEVVAGNHLSSDQLLAGWFHSGPRVVDPGCSLHGRVHIPAWLQDLPAGICALDCVAALSFRLQYVPQAFYIQKLAGTFLKSNLLRKEAFCLLAQTFQRWV